MTFARDLVEAGQVPPPEAFVVEGMFSEHDLPIEGAACSTLLCPRGAMGIAPNADGDSMAWLQVGLASTINPDTYERASLSIVVTVDVSGSMGWEYGSDGNNSAASSPAAITTNLLNEIGATSNTDFHNMAAQGADAGVGLTVFAAGLGLGADLMGAMSTLRGGNAFSLTDANEVNAFMDDNWPRLTRPIAYNLGIITVETSEALTIKDAYGFPGTEGILGAATVFLSKRKGALLLGLEMDEQVTAYEGQALDQRGVFMPQLGVDKT